MPAALQSLAYTSTAQHAFTDGELEQLLAASRAHNARRGVTGVLLYSGQCFMQVLEGEAAALDEVVARITSDPRHRGYLELYREDVEQREFGQWHMAFRRPGSLDFLQSCPHDAGAFGRAMLEGFWSRQE